MEEVSGFFDGALNIIFIFIYFIYLLYFLLAVVLLQADADLLFAFDDDVVISR